MRLRVLFATLALAFALALAACAKPVPAEKSAHVGEWTRPEMYLLITDGVELIRTAE